MSLINQFSSVSNLYFQNDLPAIENILPTAKINNTYSVDSLNITKQNLGNSFNNPVLFVKPAEINSGIIGSIGNFFNKVNDVTTNIFSPAKADKKIISTGHKDSRGRDIKLPADVAVYFDKLLGVAKTKGVRIQVNSAYRTFGEQKILWQRALKKYGSVSAARKWVAPPGKSQHNQGNAMDIAMYKNGRKVSQKEFDKIASQAGFYRPMSWEGWHIEAPVTKIDRNLA